MLPAGDEEPAIPGWMEKVDAFGPARAAATGIALTAFNPKNLILTLAGTAAIVEASISAGEQAIALTVFTVIASLGVATPVVMYFVLGERARPLPPQELDGQVQRRDHGRDPAPHRREARGRRDPGFLRIEAWRPG